MAIKRINVNIGVSRMRRTPLFPSEPGYTAQMRSSSKSVIDALLNVLEQFEDVSNEIMIEALHPTMELAVYYTPVDTGELVESAYLEEAEFRGKPRIEIGFGRGGVPHYAVIVHENM